MINPANHEVLEIPGYGVKCLKSCRKRDEACLSRTGFACRAVKKTETGLLVPVPYRVGDKGFCESAPSLARPLKYLAARLYTQLPRMQIYL